jgi:hypothetical protein
VFGSTGTRAITGVVTNGPALSSQTTGNAGGQSVGTTTGATTSSGALWLSSTSGSGSSSSGSTGGVNTNGPALSSQTTGGTVIGGQDASLAAGVSVVGRGDLWLSYTAGSGAGSSTSGSSGVESKDGPALPSQYTGNSDTDGQGNGTNTGSSVVGSHLWLLYGAGLGAASSSAGATGGSSSHFLALLSQDAGGSSAGGQGDRTVGSLTNAELWLSCWSGAGASSSAGSANGSLANAPTISAKFTGGSGGGLAFFVTGATRADATNAGSPLGTTGSTALTLANSQSTVTTAPLVYQPGSDDGPGVVTAVWTGSEEDVQFMPVADGEVQSASPQQYSGPTMQAAPPWYISAWYTFFGRLASDQPLISDPRGSKPFEAGGTTYFVPNYVRDDTFYWITGNLYHRPLIGDVIGKAELPFRFLANPGRFAIATVDGAVGTITNIPRLPEIWSDMPDYQRQDWAIRMLAIPYLGAVRPELAGTGKTPRTPAPIAGSADDAAGTATSVVDDAAKMLPPRGVRQTDTPIPEGHTRVFRAVSEDEYQDIISHRQFREGPNSLEGKWFADSLDGAIDHGFALFPNGRFRLIEVDIPNDTPSLFRQPNLDGRGPARFVHNDDLPALSPRPLE